MWVSTVQSLKELVEDDVIFPWDESWYIVVLRREDEDLVFDSDLQVKIYVADFDAARPGCNSRASLPRGLISYAFVSTTIYHTC